MTERLNLPRRFRDQLEALLREHLPDVEVWAYGSRVNGRSHEGSDLDLVLRSPTLEPLGAGYFDLLEVIDNSNIPILVQAHDWARLPESFHQEIEREHVVLVEREQARGPEYKSLVSVRTSSPTSRRSDMAGEWTERLLGELTDNFDATRVPVKQVDRRAGPYPYYGASGVVDHVDDYLFDGEYLLIAEDGENLRTRNTPIAFLVNGKFWVNNHAHIVRGNHKANTRYLMYALSELDISGYLTGSTMPKLTQGNMNRISLLTPPLPEQRAIAHILGTLDDKIELNRRMNETLEEMARALFKSWFVDFDPVRAKMEGRDPGLPEHLADLFPDRLVESELGEIPEGWNVFPLSEIMDFKEGPGIRHWQYTNSVEGTRFINIRCIQDGDLLLSTSNRITTDEANGRYAHFHLREWDIVISSSGTLGRSAVVRNAHLPLLLNTSVIRFRPVKGATSFSYLHGYLNSSVFLDELRSLATGSVQKNFGPTHLRQMRVLSPPYHCIERYEEITGPFLRETITKRTCNDTLAALRDTLMPKLVSGKLRVAEARAFH